MTEELVELLAKNMADLRGGKVTNRDLLMARHHIRAIVSAGYQIVPGDVVELREQQRNRAEYYVNRCVQQGINPDLDDILSLTRLR